jgi:zinc transporter ZupT
MSTLLASLAAAITTVWGIAHLIPTGQVVAGFGTLSKDNRLVITQEWIAEGITLTFLGGLIGLVTVVDRVSNPVVTAVYGFVAGMLLVMAVLTAVTGARGSVIFFKICPIVKTVAAVLLLASIVL